MKRFLGRKGEGSVTGGVPEDVPVNYAGSMPGSIIDDESSAGGEPESQLPKCPSCRPDNPRLQGGGGHCCQKCPQTYGASHDRDCETAEAKRQCSKDLAKQQKLTQRQIHESDMLLSAAMNDIDARINRDHAWQILLKAMKIDDASMKTHNTQGLLMGLVKLCFLAVIVGCEMSLYSFLMSWGTYWSMGEEHHQMENRSSSSSNSSNSSISTTTQPLTESLDFTLFGQHVHFTVIRLFLVLLPVGFGVAVTMFMMENWDEKKNEEEEDPIEQPAEGYAMPESGNVNEMVNETASELLTSASELGATMPLMPQPTAASAYATKKTHKTRLELYHFVPILRYYLLIKDPEPEDIEGLFRVNALSTFTLGISQGVCMMFHLFVLKAEWTIFVKIGMFTQIFSILMTLLYFLTPICNTMKHAIEVDTMKHNVEEDMKDLYTHYLDLVAMWAENPNRRMAQLQEHGKRIHQEIILLGGLAAQSKTKLAQLLKYGMEYKMEALGALRRIQYLKLAKMSQ